MNLYRYRKDMDMYVVKKTSEFENYFMLLTILVFIPKPYSLHKFIRLWVELSNVHLDEDIEDSIVRNLTINGEYTSFRLTRHNSLGPRLPFSTRSCGSPGHLQRLNSLFGWPFKIGYGRRTVLKNKVGIIVNYAPFANKLKRWRHTSFSIAASPKGFGDDKGVAPIYSYFVG
jgi:hypothetical protein